MKITLYTYLKNTDLHALSAFEAITNYLSFSALKRLKRFTKWELEFSAQENVQAALKRLLEESFSILNLNKEAYFLGTKPEATAKAQEHIFHIEVFSNQAPEPGPDLELIKAIQQKTGIQLKDLRKSLVWELTVVGKNTPEGHKEALLKEVILTTSRQKGLLVSPLYEIARFI